MNSWNLSQYDCIEYLEKVYSFKKYSTALCFLNAVAGLAETYIHHPRIVIEWGIVRVAWGTHASAEGSGVLAKDRFLAEQCDMLFELMQKKDI